MDKKTEPPKIIKETVDWCMKRCSSLSFDDTAALLSEFDEWIEYVENDDILAIDILNIKVSK